MFRPALWASAIALALACSTPPAEYTLTSEEDNARADGKENILITARIMKAGAALDRGNVTFTLDTDGASFATITDPSKPPSADAAKKSVTVSAGLATVRLYSVVPGEVTVTGIFKDDVARTSEAKTIVLSFTGAAIPLSSFKYEGATPTQVPIGGSAAIKFLAKDSGGKPVANLPVTFTVAPEGTATVEPAGKTDSAGIATTTLTAGDTAGNVVVTVSGGSGEYERSLQSDAIAISGGVLNGKNLTLSCPHYSIAGFELNGLQMECTVFGSDYNKAFVPDSRVLFMTEAGGVPASVAFSADAANGGIAKFTYRTQCAQPRDVAPLGAEYGDPGTPCIFYDTCKTPPETQNRTCNSRDGKATLVAYTTGQEPFTDTNGNQTWDEGESFEDLSEPFVDANDNGTRDPDEDFYDANKINGWDDKNGKWDPKTTIWRMVNIWWTGPPESLEMMPGNNLVLPHCTNKTYTGILSDFNGNPPTAAASGDRVEATCNTGCKVAKVSGYADRSDGTPANPSGMLSVEIADAHACPAECIAPGCGSAYFQFDVFISRTLDAKATSKTAKEDLTAITHDSSGGSPGPRSGTFL